MGKRTQMFGVFVIWGALLIVFGVIAGALQMDWLIFIPLGGALVHALAVASKK
jgi:hypothetical protein